MAQLGGIFNANEVAERGDFEPVPPGAYTAMIVASELKDTSTGGKMIVLELDIQGGENDGRKLFENLNIENANPKAVDIAYRTLGEIVRAVGKSTIKDTDELHNLRMTVNVKVDPAQPYVDKNTGEKKAGKPKNSITRYLPYSATATSQPAATTQAQVASSEAGAPPADASVPPWKRKQG